MAGFCEHVNEPTVPIKSRLLFDKLSEYQLFKEYPAPRSEWVCTFHRKKMFAQEECLYRRAGGGGVCVLLQRYPLNFFITD
jgi:hypothetical protein